ncbi:DNA internalization-related competence protein ComEC/Rec2 [Halomonas sp. 18H]|uniref:DNA internalization-related competence protein ComEC/Rec2 n=1 Tax=Halomonas almeriensis TaxID=308163 RepID=UPI002232255B|nr:MULTISPECIES: DNA internalization-related competence protein ComEC/Rec2 [Halomonas]MCW4151678.1 DNA internalization-related competence protein ComEC/Rec2 [Halomonas sp. 18H]MDN3552814.1 DNA internalization-related competence protein ComEC/Rec2 [Halomonas almeriensis]
MPLALATLLGIVVAALAAAAWLQLVALAGLCALAQRRWRGLALAGVVLLVAVRVLAVIDGELAPGLSRQEVRLDAEVEAVSRQAGMARLDLRVEACRPMRAQLPSCRNLSRARLSVYQGPKIRAGERWRFTARLRPPSGFRNPGTFNYRGWLWREGIQATGYLRASPPPRRLAKASPSVHRRALSHLAAQDLGARPARWLAALTLGAEDQLTRDDWDLLNATGTTHLVVISGLHIGLVAAFSLLLCRGLARALRPGNWRLAIWPWWAAGLCACGYALLAGLEAPALRALVMALVGLWVASGRHAPGAWQAWWLALAVVLLIDPLSAWRPGFWLSFVAVAVLIVIWQGRTRPQGATGWCLALVRTQCLLAPIMAAAVLLAFGRVAPAAPLINLVAVPLVSSLLVPLGLAGWLLAWLPPLSSACWTLFAMLSESLAALLEFGVAVSPLWEPAAPRRLPLAFGLALGGLAWALPGLAGSWRGLLTGLVILGLAWPKAEPLPAGELRVRVHDVGQGQLVELRTRDYRLLVDTGPRFGSGFMPLESLWPPGQYFDDVLVSHGDRDHAGGLQALEEQHAVARYLAPAEADLPVAFQPCHTGQSWHRDGVAFRVLWPPETLRGLSRNDRSCVLLVRTGSHRLLIPGDVGRRVERSFVARMEAGISVLVAGHHGSRTSSGPTLVSRLDPGVVIYSAALDGRFEHPADEVVRRFRRAGSCQWSTAQDGAVTLHLADGAVPSIETAGGASHGPGPPRPGPGRNGGVGQDCLAVESASGKR